MNIKTQMMDAGMTLFTSEKPFGTVLGGIKMEMSKYGAVRRANEISAEEIPDTTGECDLFVDWSTPLRWRAISCRLEDAGPAGTNAEGAELRRYAASFKEGNKNRVAKVVIVLALAAALVALGVIGVKGVPGIFTVLAGIAAAAALVILGLRPSVKAQQAIKDLMETVSKAK